jgi:hypothetical protein
VLTLGARNAFTRIARQAHGLVTQFTCSGRLAPGGVVRSIFRFAFVVVPTAVLAAAVVVGVSGRSQTAATLDGDFQRDLNLASTTSLELPPAGIPLATVSAIEASPAPTPVRSTRPKVSNRGPRVVRSRAPTVTAAPEPEAAAEEESAVTTTELAEGEAEADAAAPAPGGVALPRPTAIPVAYPTGSGDAGTYDPGPGTVIRGGGIDPDHCQIHDRRRGGRVYPPIFRQPSGPSLGDRIRGARTSSGSRPESIGDRVRQASSSRSRSEGRSSSGSRSIGDRVRAARSR